MRLSYTQGQVAAGEFEVVSVPKLFIGPPKAPIIFCHGYADSSAAGAALSNSVYAKLFADVSRQGTVVVAADLGNNAWSSDLAADRFEAARQLAVTLGAARRPPVAYCFSMGFLTAFAYRRKYPTGLSAVVGVCPASDLQGIKTGALANVTSIDTALGIGAGDPIPARFDPTQSPGVLADTPGRLYYGQADATVLPATVQRLGGLMGWPATSFDASNPHMSDAQLANLPRAEVTSYLAAAL